MTTQYSDTLEKSELDRLIGGFFRAVTFEAGTAPPSTHLRAVHRISAPHETQAPLLRYRPCESLLSRVRQWYAPAN